MSLTQSVANIDREQLGLSYISCPLLLRFRGPRHDNTSPSTLWITTSTLLGFAQSQKMDGFCRNFLDLVWFSANVVCREVEVALSSLFYNQ